ncbi:MAG: hypothetical protein ACPHRO_11230, partial [Nannocystaceae bacterium]
MSEGAMMKMMKMPMPTHKNSRRVSPPRALRTSVSAALIVSLGIGTVISTPSTAAAGAVGDGLALSSQRAAPADSDAPSEGESKMERGKRLYYEGVTDYKLGKFEQALGKFEEAYALTSAPNILRNIAVTLGRVAEVNDDMGKLRESRAMWKNYLSEVYKNPSLLNADQGETVEDVEATLAKIDAELATLEEEEEARAREIAEREAELEASRAANREPIGPDPGVADRKRGLLWLSVGGGVGGVLAATGLGLMTAFGAKASAVDSQARANEVAQQNEFCADITSANQVNCLTLIDEAERINSEGRRAQTNMLAIGLPVAVVGVG